MEKFTYTLMRRSQVTHTEIVCQRHREEMEVDGGFMGPLSPGEERSGVTQRFTKYDGDRECTCCAEASKHQAQGAA